MSLLQLTSPCMQSVAVTVPPFWVDVRTIREWVADKRRMANATLIQCLFRLVRLGVLERKGNRASSIYRFKWKIKT
jgi:hypothetical protein